MLAAERFGDQQLENQQMKQPARPSISALQELLVLVDKQGVTKAAAALKTSQPTMSRRLKVFQRDAGGVDVLEKQGKSLMLTDRGRRALPAIHELVRQYEHLFNYFAGEATAPQVVRLGTGSFAAQYYLPRALAEIHKQPVIWVLKNSICRGRKRILRTAEGKFDLAVVSHDPLQIETMVSVHLGPERTLQIEPLAKQRFCVVAQSGSPAGRELAKIDVGTSVLPEMLTRWRLVGLDRESGIRRKIQRHLIGLKLKSPGLKFLSRTGLGGWPVAKEYARQGLGVAVLPLAGLTADDTRELTIRRLSEQLVMEDFLIHRTDLLNTAQQTVKDALQRAAKKHEQNVRRMWKNLT
jgi:DNA-binding transcriptional LysR family regulator